MAVEENRGKLCSEITNYLKQQLSSDWYAPILEQMLVEHDLVPTKNRSLKESIEKLVGGKKVVEVGCRRAHFLRFLADHGAIVSGTTADRYLEDAKKMLGKKGIVAGASAQEAWKKLGGAQPDFIISVNLFDKKRWQSGRITIPPHELLEKITRLASAKTNVYIHPTIGYDSMLTKEHFSIVPGVTDLVESTKHLEGNEKRPQDITYSFKVKQVERRSNIKQFFRKRR